MNLTKCSDFFWTILFNSICVPLKLLPLKKNRIIFNSAENKNYNYNSMYLFEYMKKRNTQYEIYFVIDDCNLRKKLSDMYGESYFIKTNSLRSCFLIARAKVWILSTLESPYICVIKNKDRVVYHLGHGVPLKAIGQLAKFPSKAKLLLQKYLRIRPITHVLCYSRKYEQNMIAIFDSPRIQYVPLGQPRNDSINLLDSYRTLEIIKSAICNLPLFNKTILYCPTWRPYEKTRFFPFPDMNAQDLNKVLKDTDTVLFLRGHPYFESDCPQDFENQSNIHWLNSNVINDITSHLGFFDKLITDYSSIFIDYLCVNKPIGFLQYDYSEYDGKVGFATSNKEIYCGVSINSSDEFIKFILNEDDELWAAKRNEIVQLLNVKNTGNNQENSEFIDLIIQR